MRRIVCVLLISTSLAPGCRRSKPEAKVAQPPPAIATTQPEPPPEVKVLEQSRLGSKISDGDVAEEKASFARDEPVYLTMWLKESPPGLQTTVRWYDDTGIVVSEERRPMFGMKVVTFGLGVKRPKPGNYRAVGYSGDKVAVIYHFQITE